MPTEQTKLKSTGLAGRLVRDGLLTEAQMRAYEQVVNREAGFVGYLVEQKLLSSQQVALAAANEFGVPLLDLNAIDTTNLPLNLVADRLIRKHRALPLLKRGNRLFLAISDPTNDPALEEIRFYTGLATTAVIVEEDKLNAVLKKILEAQEAASSAIPDFDLTKAIVSEEEETRDDSDVNVDEAPIVMYVNGILTKAMKEKASDIHFEPYEKTFRIRFRQDGLLQEVASPPLAIANRLTARLKVMSRMNIAERRIPQDGRIKLKLSADRDIDFRVNTLPTLYGEKIVLRILDSTAAQVGIEALGLEEEQRQAFLGAIHKPYGMILVTGPTGSGKTVSLYTALNILNQPGVNISTVEDPVEIQVSGINQVNLNPKSGLTFAAALRAFLRQDPDVIMVGEIRDLETAEIAVKAAQTGHLVLSTLHTNDAPQTLTRLANMGVPAFNIASSVLLIMAQRLARKLCPFCKLEVHLPPDILRREGFRDEEIAAGLKIYGPRIADPAKGEIPCERCNRGYKGRVGIFQVMRITEEISRLILEGGNALQLAEQAQREGVADLRRSGLKKIKTGVTSLEEINRVTKE